MITDLLAQIPLWVLVSAMVACALLLGAAVFLALRGRTTTNGALLGGALSSLAIVYICALGMNANAQMAWGRSTLGLENPWTAGVPLSLDGVNIAVGLFAAWLVRHGRDARKAWLIVWGGTLLSAYISGTEGAEHDQAATVYLAALALVVMGIFHLVVEQTHPEAGAFHGDNPKFGVRWLTKACGKTATLLLWLDWVNSPPAKGTYPEPSVDDAIQHRANVLQARRDAAETVAAAAELEQEQRQIRQAESRRRVADAERADTIAELRQAIDEALTKVAQEVDARNELAALAAEERARLEASVADREVTIAKLSAALARADRGREQKPRTGSGSRGGQRPNRPSGQAGEQNREQVPPSVSEQVGGQNPSGPTEQNDGVTALRSDEQIVAALREAWAKEIADTGKGLSRYRIETDGKCASRQARRVMDALEAEMPSIKTGVRNDQEASQ